MCLAILKIEKNVCLTRYDMLKNIDMLYLSNAATSSMITIIYR